MGTNGNWSVSDKADNELTLRIIHGDYRALKESVAESNRIIRETRTSYSDKKGSPSQEPAKPAP